ncbi:TetR/AcrR family transcriptional regulator [Brucella pseudogrignonensis]|uniref:TetR/AcrR family transcriptional regulator n=1 Tax=Brucella pseudogrignonensis TaxID=419475 RepID=UPI00124D2024|nr:TetR/AcrR family transcriptional regulator [Brucella pseudogrignonensis]KAB2685855.1 TetR/AcrR family transcriptional regulator [Brucella pseudogrignonensis]MBK0023013.1 TetR/AcrR family transcriptional regulator [Ochrobactrum sp. S45]MBK0045029.1 TetR/AcrR family transcriptional regulator [Ochrobactrum sp. S46]UKK95871.1 TetR/AcrR family transcriptional regulator [Brucella pseudogrignonensis]
MASHIAPTRDRIIAAASTLFHQQGIKAASVDLIAERAGLTKRSLYYHFRSKDDLIAACLEARDAPNLTILQQWYARSTGDVAQKVNGIFLGLARAARRKDWKGCGFLRAAVELVELPGHPALVAGRAHKKRVEDWLCCLLAKGQDIVDARRLAAQIMLLLDGAFATVLLHREPAYFETAGLAAMTLIRSTKT